MLLGFCYLLWSLWLNIWGPLRYIITAQCDSGRPKCVLWSRGPYKSEDLAIYSPALNILMKPLFKSQCQCQWDEDYGRWGLHNILHEDWRNDIRDLPCHKCKESLYFIEFLHRWLVPILATHVGALAGAWLYYLAVEANWPAEGDTVEAEAVDQVGSWSSNVTIYKHI